MRWFGIVEIFKTQTHALRRIRCFFIHRRSIDVTHGRLWWRTPRAYSLLWSVRDKDEADSVSRPATQRFPTVFQLCETDDCGEHCSHDISTVLTIKRLKCLCTLRWYKTCVVKESRVHWRNIYIYILLCTYRCHSIHCIFHVYLKRLMQRVLGRSVEIIALWKACVWKDVKYTYNRRIHCYKLIGRQMCVKRVW